MSNFPDGMNHKLLDGMPQALEQDKREVECMADAVSCMLEAVAKVATRFRITLLPASFAMLAETLVEELSENVDGELERLAEAGYESSVKPDDLPAVCKRASEITFEAVRIKTLQTGKLFEALRPFPVNSQTYRDIAEANETASKSEGV